MIFDSFYHLNEMIWGICSRIFYNRRNKSKLSSVGEDMALNNMFSP